MIRFAVFSVFFIFSNNVFADWDYSNEPDKMGRGNNEIAAVKSTDTITLQSPYDGAQHATFALRKMQKGNNEFLFSFERGQIVCGASNCTLTARIDDNKPFILRGNHPEDGSSNAVIGSVDAATLKSIRNGKKLLIESTIYQNGEKISEFNIQQTPFVGQKVYELDEIRSFLKSKQEIPLDKTSSFSLNTSNFDICKKVLKTTSDKDDDEIRVVLVNSKNEMIVIKYSETFVSKSVCEKGSKEMKMEFFNYL
ncbi:hypothetical protein AB6870_12385 [Rahnella inusitata]|uniref:hypothetical protein n=1 Tax=Rahnella inusitata TaxID=58169 RepID=UPI0039BDD394